MKEKLKKFAGGRYGLDSFGKMLVITGGFVYILGGLMQSGMLISLSTIVIIYALYRIMSRQHWDRSEENRKYLDFKKLWKLRWDNRKYFRIFRCKRCGKFVRVPKGKGKIEVTCTSCGSKTMHRT